MYSCYGSGRVVSFQIFSNEYFVTRHLCTLVLCGGYYNKFLLLQVSEIYNFTQDDLMTEDIFILDSHSEIFVWVGQQVDSKSKLQALTIGEVSSIR
jgi:hypothetical protein